VPRTRLTAPGWFSLSIGILLVLAGLLTGCASVAGTGVCLVLLPVIALPCAAFNLAGLRFSVEAPANIPAGQTFQLDLIVNGCRRPLRAFAVSLEVDSSPPILCAPILVAAIPTTAPARLTRQALAHQRGFRPTCRYRLVSSFPLGLASGVICGETELNLAVTPRAVHARPLPPADLHATTGSHRALQQACDETGLSRSLRDYVMGDPPRLIDWKASARRSTLVSREFERAGPQTVRLLFHSYQPRLESQLAVLPRQGFETALGHFMGIAEHLSRSRRPLLIWGDFMQDDALRHIDLGTPGYAGFLRDLADAQVRPRSHLKRLLRIITERSTHDCLTLIVSNCPRRCWERRIAALVRGPVICLDNNGIPPT
jgi:uncharacterized protein (DUF58 family)